MAKLVSNLHKIAAMVGPAVERALLATGKDILDVSQQLVAVDTGKLKASGGVIPITSTHVVVGYGSPGSEREEVAHYIEYGTVNSPAQPYLTPAFEQNVETFKARLAEEVSRIT